MVDRALTPVLSIRDLHIATEAGDEVVRGVSLDVMRGEVLAVIGASGSGKTTLALTALGRLRPGLRVSGGSVRLEGQEMLGAPRDRLNMLRGAHVAYIAQSAAASFNPRMRLGRQVIESALLHRNQSRAVAETRARANMKLLSLRNAAIIARRFPHQVSGGQLQRFMIAMGMQERPVMLVCDEPTSALDVTTQVEVIAELKRAVAAQNTAALFISHDLAVVAQLATRIAVMRRGELVEVGTTDQILENPRMAYTQELLDACRHFGGADASVVPPARLRADAEPVFTGKDIFAGYGKPDASGLPRLTTLHGASVTVRSGEIVALIGESGSGKSTFARVLAGLLPAARGEIVFRGRRLASDVRARSQDDRRRIQMVYQSADTALNPRQSVRRILGRTLKFHRGLRGAAAEARMVELMDLVRLPASHLDRRPMELSGGEKQRLNLARALAAEPEVLICDEITSALDTIVAKGIIALIEDLRARLGLAILFISHDLATVASLADRVLVLRAGREVESGTTRAILAEHSDPYTRLLIRSVPQLRRGWLEEAEAARAEIALAEPTGKHEED